MGALYSRDGAPNSFACAFLPEVHNVQTECALARKLFSFVVAF